eukprot:GILK01000405.1.p1 GENE.GILK01000405.1~~GILK01000405.1.p1  ORF type:complete len:338 (+),score=50.86 GILK01000405.1:50-1063(+)
MSLFFSILLLLLCVAAIYVYRRYKKDLKTNEAATDAFATLVEQFADRDADMKRAPAFDWQPATARACEPDSSGKNLFYAKPLTPELHCKVVEYYKSLSQTHQHKLVVMDMMRLKKVVDRDKLLVQFPHLERALPLVNNRKLIQELRNLFVRFASVHLEDQEKAFLTVESRNHLKTLNVGIPHSIFIEAGVLKQLDFSSLPTVDEDGNSYRHADKPGWRFRDQEEEYVSTAYLLSHFSGIVLDIFLSRLVKRYVKHAKSIARIEARESTPSDNSDTLCKPVRFCDSPFCDVSEKERGGFRHCGKCKQMVYCDKICQVQHWRCGHKNECKSPATKSKQQ